MRDQPSAEFLPIIIDAIAHSKSAFEQYNALCAARERKPRLSAEGLAELRAAVRAQMTVDGHIRPSSDRYIIAQEVLSDGLETPVSSRVPKPASALPS